MRRATLCRLAVAALLGACSATLLAQPAIDRTDPTAVATAYVEACRTGDLATVLALLAPDDPVGATMAEDVRGMSGALEEEGLSVQSFVVELLFMPFKLDMAAEVTGSEVEGGRATVRIRRELPIEQQILLDKQADGTWQVRLVDSVKATTGREHSFLEVEQSGGGGTSGPDVWRSQQRLRTLHQALEEYAGEHDSRYPPAGTWMDAIELYVLDREVFQCPAAPDLPYGYAMNVEASEQPVPQDWQAKRGLILLFEWPSEEPNANLTTEELAGAKSLRPNGSVVVLDASGNTRAVPQGTTLERLAEVAEQESTCQQHLSALVSAARRYARDHDGVLPGADTWQDDLAAYLLDEADPEALFRCPAAPEVQYAYAINEEVAGKDARELTGHDQIILFFESLLDVPNAGGLPGRDSPTEPRHLSEWSGEPGNLVAYLSGSTSSQPFAEGAANP